MTIALRIFLAIAGAGRRAFFSYLAQFKIEGNTVTIHLKKKAHLPILFELPWMQQTTRLSWMNLNIQYVSGRVS